VGGVLRDAAAVLRRLDSNHFNGGSRRRWLLSPSFLIVNIALADTPTPITTPVLTLAVMFRRARPFLS
jgi:hypothetical protein